MSIQALQLTPFIHSASPDSLRIVHVEGLWEARAGTTTLAKPEGEVGFVNLLGLLSILAGAGIRASVVEWDGLPAWSYDKTN